MFDLMKKTKQQSGHGWLKKANPKLGVKLT
jgi:hypothetical protein